MLKADLEIGSCHHLKVEDKIITRNDQKFTVVNQMKKLLDYDKNFPIF